MFCKIEDGKISIFGRDKKLNCTWLWIEKSMVQKEESLYSDYLKKMMIKSLKGYECNRGEVGLLLNVEEVSRKDARIIDGWSVDYPKKKKYFYKILKKYVIDVDARVRLEQSLDGCWDVCRMAPIGWSKLMKAPLKLVGSVVGKFESDKKSSDVHLTPPSRSSKQKRSSSIAKRLKSNPRKRQPRKMFGQFVRDDTKSSMRMSSKAKIVMKIAKTMKKKKKM